MNRVCTSLAVAAVALLVSACETPAGNQGNQGEAPSGNQAPPKLLAPSNVEVKPEIRQSARNAITAALTSKDPVVRAHAIEGMREALGTAAKPQIIAALKDPDPLVKFAAAMAAGELRIAEAKPLLQPLLSEKHGSHVQMAAIFAYHRLGDVRFSAGLEQALKSTDAEVRANAAFVLGRLGEKSAIKILQPALRDRAVEVRIQAAEAMRRLGDQEGLKYLVAAGLSGHPAQQMVGLLALAGPRDVLVVEHIRAGLSSDYLEVVLVAARGLGMLGSAEAFDTALEATRSNEKRQRYLAALALGAIARADAQDALAALLKDSDPDIRLAAATAILQLQ